MVACSDELTTLHVAAAWRTHCPALLVCGCERVAVWPKEDIDSHMGLTYDGIRAAGAPAGSCSGLLAWRRLWGRAWLAGWLGARRAAGLAAAFPSWTYAQVLCVVSPLRPPTRRATDTKPAIQIRTDAQQVPSKWAVSRSISFRISAPRTTLLSGGGIVPGPSGMHSSRPARTLELRGLCGGGPRQPYHTPPTRGDPAHRATLFKRGWNSSGRVGSVTLAHRREYGSGVRRGWIDGC
jgi:hypothetical protein